MKIIASDLDQMTGIEQLSFTAVAVARMEHQDEPIAALGHGHVSHPRIGDKIAVAVAAGQQVLAALLSPSEAEAFALRLLRLAATALSEGTA